MDDELRTRGRRSGAQQKDPLLVANIPRRYRLINWKYRTFQARLKETDSALQCTHRECETVESWKLSLSPTRLSSGLPAWRETKSDHPGCRLTRACKTLVRSWCPAPASRTSSFARGAAKDDLDSCFPTAEESLVKAITAAITALHALSAGFGRCRGPAYPRAAGSPSTNPRILRGMFQWGIEKSCWTDVVDQPPNATAAPRLKSRPPKPFRLNCKSNPSTNYSPSFIGQSKMTTFGGPGGQQKHFAPNPSVSPPPPLPPLTSPPDPSAAPSRSTTTASARPP
jgi:hypothetical protein